MQATTLTIHNKIGLHARPAALFFQTARRFKSAITIQNLSRPGSPAVAVSAFNMLQIGVKQGHQIQVCADGEDAEDALEALAALVASHFGEE